MRSFLLGLGLLAAAPAHAGGTQWVFSNPTGSTYSYYSGYYYGYSYGYGYSYSYSTPASDTDTDTDTDTDADADTDTDTTQSGTGDTGGGKEGCNCDQSNTAGSAVGLLGAVALIARRRR